MPILTVNGMADRDLFGKLLPAGVAPPARQLALGLTVSLKPAADGSPLRLALWRSQGDKDMGQVTGAFRDPDIGGRWSAALKRRYPGPHAAKRIAQDFDCEPRTAEAWLSGQAPYAKYLIRAWRKHGHAIIGEVLAPDDTAMQSALDDAALIGLEQRLAQLGDELSRLKLERG